MSHRVRWLTNSAVFQLGWFACVLGAVAIPYVALALAVQALGWSVLVPAFARLALYLYEADDGSNAEQCPSLEQGG